MMTTDDKRALCGPITIDGQRASVGGARLDYALVAMLPDGPDVKYSWPAVARMREREAPYCARCSRHLRDGERRHGVPECSTH